MTDTQPLARFIEKHGISMTAERTDSNPNMIDSGDMDHWKVTLVTTGGIFGKSRRQLTTYFSMGYGHNGAEPSVSMVLDALASDASGVDSANRDFESWASEYGYDTDSRKAERIFKACEKLRDKLEKFLGYDALDDLLWHTERE
jgi:hypothetical protein